MLVELNNSADNVAIVLKVVMPIRMCKHDVGGTIWTMLIGAMEEPAKKRLNPQYIKVVSAGFLDPDAG